MLDSSDMHDWIEATTENRAPVERKMCHSFLTELLLAK